MKSPGLECYERAFAARLGVKQAFGFWKGRVAAYAILKALAVGEGDEVLLPGYTCVMAVNPVVYLGATPVFVDIEPITYNLDANLLADRLTARTKCIVAQHTYGYPADLDAILAVADRAGVPVVEDCCLALGSKYKDHTVGRFGIASYFSFQWNKPYTSGLGGMAITDDAELATKIEAVCQRELHSPAPSTVAMLAAQFAVHRALVYPRTTALAQELYRRLSRAGVVVGSSAAEEFTPARPDGFFTGMSDLQARAGLQGLRHLDRSIRHRRRLKRLYDTLLRERGWSVPAIPPESDPVLVRYPIRVADKAKALATATRRFVELGSWFESPLHPAETPLAAYGYRSGMCPHAERASREVVNLPLHPRVTAAVVRRCVDFVAEIGPARCSN